MEDLGVFPLSRWSMYHFMQQAKKDDWSGEFTIVNMGAEYVDW
jgi:hypothetical protein